MNRRDLVRREWWLGVAAVVVVRVVLGFVARRDAARRSATAGTAESAHTLV